MRARIPEGGRPGGAAIGSVDTCFLIDWARYSRRGILEELLKEDP